MVKILKMSIDELRNEFKEIDKTEQMFYVGGVKYEFNEYGKLVSVSNTSYLSKDEVICNGKTLELPVGMECR